MPIIKFNIKDVGPIKLAEASNLPSVIILAGPNGVGKSTLLESLKKMGPNVFVEGNGKFLYIPPYRTPASFSLHKSLPVIGPRTTYRDILTSDSFSFYAPGISLPGWITSGGSRSRMTPDFAPYFEVKYKLVQFQQEFEHTLAEVFKKLKKVPEGYMPEDIYTPFRELIERLLPGIKFIEITLEGETYGIYFVNRLGSRVEFDQLSSGEKDLIAMLFPFIEKEIENELAKVKGEELLHEDLVILIDTPEAYLHPTLQINLLDYIHSSVREAEKRGEKLQFFIVTHSPTIIKEAKFEELYVMVFPDQSPDGNQITRITTDADKFNFIHDILGDIGFSFLTAGKPLLILEGENDIEILKILKPNIEAKFTLLPFSGKGKILVFSKAFKEVVSELRTRGFRLFTIVDRNSDIDNYQDDFCFVWSRSCIENFLLLDPEAIYEALKVIIGESNLQNSGVKSKEEINNLIEQIIKDPETINEEIKRRIKKELKIYIGGDWEDLEELRKIASATCEKKLNRIQEKYQTLESTIKEIANRKERALIELNGKIILGKLAKKFKFNIQREILARTIADKLKNLNRIPEEITNLINDLEKKIR